MKLTVKLEPELEDRITNEARRLGINLTDAATYLLYKGLLPTAVDNADRRQIQERMATLRDGKNPKQEKNLIIGTELPR